MKMLTRSQRRFSIFFTLCEDKLNGQLGYWYDRIAMTKVLQCNSYRQVWHEVIMPYNETYFREEIQSLWDTAGHLARRHELTTITDKNEGGTRVHCLSTTL